MASENISRAKWTNGAAASLFAVLATMQMHGQTGQVMGTILDDKGKGLPGAFVMLNKASAEGGPFSSKEGTSSDGSFTFAMVPAGNYRLCVQSAVSGLLDPCRWSMRIPIVRITTGQNVQVGQVQLAKGHPLQLHLLDDSGQLDARLGRVPGAQVLVGVWGPSGLFERMHLKSKDAKGRHYELLVPFDTSLKVSIESAYFALSDDQRMPIDKVRGSMLPLQVPSQGIPPTLTYHVTGVN